jgi:DNA polymerase
MPKADELAAVRERASRDPTLDIEGGGKNLVFGKGNPDAPILFIGEAPGAQEDLQGIPFVGAAGKELDKLLHRIGLTITDVYIANILKYRPPENRDPTPAEIRAHTPYLVEQIRIINPRVVCTLGNYATKFLLAHFDASAMAKQPGITSVHGKTVELSIEHLRFTLYPLYHPAAILYNPKLRSDLESDFLKLGELLQTKPQEKNADLESWK